MLAKFILVSCFCFFLTFVVIESCSSDRDCLQGIECCRKSFPLFGSNGCIKLGGYQERCGGQTLCECLPEYDCVVEEQTIANRFRKGNGTCQISLQQQANQRRFFIDV